MTDEIARRDGWSFAINNREQFERIWDDVDRGREYDAGDLGAAPVIVDAGAHVGVATHWLARRYPGAVILSFEANPDTFRLLRRNLRENGVTQSIPFNVAVGDRWDGVAFFTMPGDTWGDSAFRHTWHDERTVELRVPSLPLSALLTRPIDLLKLDIEGYETAALADAERAGVLGNVGRIVLEFHGNAMNPENRLEDLLEVLDRAGFRITIEQGGQIKPLSRIERDGNFWLIIRGGRGRSWPRANRQAFR
ncbi:MAG: FkbM family methyltransferase [Thermomicrobiales bacterium]